MVGLISGVHRFRRVSVCIHPGMNACICMYIYIYMHKHTYLHMHICVRTHIHTCAYRHTYTGRYRTECAWATVYLGVGLEGSDTEHPGADLS